MIRLRAVSTFHKFFHAHSIGVAVCFGNDLVLPVLAAGIFGEEMSIVHIGRNLNHDGGTGCDAILCVPVKVRISEICHRLACHGQVARTDFVVRPDIHKVVFYSLITTGILYGRTGRLTDPHPLCRALRCAILHAHALDSYHGGGRLLQGFHAGFQGFEVVLGCHTPHPCCDTGVFRVSDRQVQVVFERSRCFAVICRHPVRFVRLGHHDAVKHFFSITSLCIDTDFRHIVGGCNVFVRCDQGKLAGCSIYNFAFCHAKIILSGFQRNHFSQCLRAFRSRIGSVSELEACKLNLVSGKVLCVQLFAFFCKQILVNF